MLEAVQPFVSFLKLYVFCFLCVPYYLTKISLIHSDYAV